MGQRQPIDVITPGICEKMCAHHSLPSHSEQLHHSLHFYLPPRTNSPSPVFFPILKKQVIKIRWVNVTSAFNHFTPFQRSGRRMSDSKEKISTQMIPLGWKSSYDIFRLLNWLKDQIRKERRCHYLLDRVSVHFSCHVNAIELLHSS